MVRLSRTAIRGGVGATRPFPFSATIAALIVCALAVAGCSSAPAPTAESEVEATVVRYDKLLAEGYRTLDMSRLKEVSEQLQAEDEYVHMSALAEGGVRLLPVLKERDFLKVSVEGTSATVETRERWDYTHEDRSTRQIILVQKDLIYEMAWDLNRYPDGRWYVSDVRAMSATATVPAQQIATPTPGAERF